MCLEEPQGIISQLMIHGCPVVWAEPPYTSDLTWLSPVVCTSPWQRENKQAQLLLLLLINEKTPKTGQLIAIGGMTGSELRFLLCFYSALCLRASLVNGMPLVLHQANVQKRPRWAEQSDPALYHPPSSMHNTVPQKDGAPLSKFPVRLYQENMHFLVNCCTLATWTSFPQCDEPLPCRRGCPTCQGLSEDGLWWKTLQMKRCQNRTQISAHRAFQPIRPLFTHQTHEFGKMLDFLKSLKTRRTLHLISRGNKKTEPRLPSQAQNTAQAHLGRWRTPACAGLSF